MTKPITPSEVADKKARSIKPEMIEAANELIVRNWDGTQAVVTLPELDKLARSKLGMKVGEPFESGAYDLEDAFRKAGWVVEFDKPAYNETYVAFFVFKKRRMR